LNNNNRGNNRRRGRGNNRPQGGNQLNRIDSRARGNAPQLLEKYRKLAQDASLNGDRVQAEYYLQFADHYFRVIADSRSPKDEMRPRRDNERGQESSGQDSSGQDSGGQYSAGEDGEDDYRRRDDRYEDDGYSEDGEGADNAPSASDYEPPANPFVRDNRPERGERPERGQRPERGDRTRGELRRPRKPHTDQAEPAPVLDPSILPPAIGAGGNDGDAAETVEAPKPRRRTRRPRSEGENGGDEGGEVFEQVG
jgi:Domain of unknown function (DUF4167)